MDGWVVGGGWVGGKGAVGWAGKPKAGPLPSGHRQWPCVPSRQQGCTYTNHRIDRDGHWQQPGTQPIPISAPQWPHRPCCNASMRFYRVGKSCL